MKNFIYNKALDIKLSNLILDPRYIDRIVLLPVKINHCGKTISSFVITTIKKRSTKSLVDYFAIIIIKHVLLYLRGKKTSHQST